MLSKKATIVATDKEHLLVLIQQAIACDGLECDLNHIDVSLVTDMSWLFDGSAFNGSIDRWNVSSVTDMSYMFKDSKFNGDISCWNVSKVIDLGSMFYNSKFNADISKWNIANVQSMDGMIDADKLGLFKNYEFSLVLRLSG